MSSEAAQTTLQSDIYQTLARAKELLGDVTYDSVENGLEGRLPFDRATGPNGSPMDYELVHGIYGDKEVFRITAIDSETSREVLYIDSPDEGTITCCFLYGSDADTDQQEALLRFQQHLKSVENFSVSETDTVEILPEEMPTMELNVNGQTIDGQSTTGRIPEQRDPLPTAELKEGLGDIARMVGSRASRLYTDHRVCSYFVSVGHPQRPRPNSISEKVTVPFQFDVTVWNDGRLGLERKSHRSDVVESYEFDPSKPVDEAVTNGKGAASKELYLSFQRLILEIQSGFDSYSSH